MESLQIVFFPRRWRKGGQGRTGRTREIKAGRGMERKKGTYVRWGLRMLKGRERKGSEDQRDARKRTGKGRRAKGRGGIGNKKVAQS